MTASEMLDILRTLDADVSVNEVSPGQWKVSLPRVRIVSATDYELAGGSGESAEDATRQTFEHLTSPLPGKVIEANYRKMRWNGSAFVAVEAV